jgi:hypothetical protein
MKTRIPPVLIIFALVCVALVQNAQAVVPAPDGGYPGANTAEGDNALLNVNTAIGINNTAVGANALRDDTTGYYNVAIGSGALANNTTGNFNMAIGTDALTNNNANFNVAVGFRVLFMNTTGNHLTGLGAAALRNNTTGGFNTAIGADALKENTTSSGNTAIGADALSKNTTGSSNTATGDLALFNNTTGNDNTATGDSTLAGNASGYQNTANGFEALLNNITGFGNTASGLQALFFNSSGIYNTADGFRALQNNTTGQRNIALGADAGSEIITANNVIAIGIAGADVSNTCFIGHIRGVTTGNANAIPVLIDSAGQLGTASSSRRFKREVKPMDKASEAILGLKPVTFAYKSDDTATPQFGLIAEEVAAVNPDLVVRDENGEIYTVRYDAVNAMLLNEFLKEHGKVAKLEAIVAQQHKDFEAAVAELKGQIQKVRAQLELSKPAAQTVLNKR